MNRREWCMVLAKLVSPSFPMEAQKALTDMLPAMQHMPDSSFTDATVTHVACWKRRQAVPAFDEIVAALRDFRATFVPNPMLALPRPAPEPDPPPPTPEELAYVAERVREAKEVAADHAREREKWERPLPALKDVSAKGAELVHIRAERAKRMGAPA